MDIRALMIEPADLWQGASPWRGAAAFVSLDPVGAWPDEPVLPPCPVIGIGDPGHAFAAACDCIAEPPVNAEALQSAILARPQAAAAVVQLLRIVPQLPIGQALIAESMAYAMLQGSSEHRAWQASRPARSHAPSPEGQVHVSRGEAGTLTLVLDNPAANNAIDRAMRDALHEALSLAALDPEIERVRLLGGPRAFSMGAELSEFGTTTDPASAHAIRMQTLPAFPAARCAGKLEVHVRGACVGAGLEIAAWAKRLTAASNAWFQLPELSMGILPGAGGCVSLARRIGRQRTALMILSGRRISARTALAWGLIDAIVDDPPGA